jgi:hypothetical protein
MAIGAKGTGKKKLKKKTSAAGLRDQKKRTKIKSWKITWNPDDTTRFMHDSMGFTPLLAPPKPKTN